MTLFNQLAIPGVVEIIPSRFSDSRGFFSEVFKHHELAANGIAIDWVQDNQSFSTYAGTVRGLHLQAPPFAQDKLVRVLAGAIFDVAVDVRQGSPHYGKWVGLELSAEKWNQLLIPTGFAHGFMTLMPNTEVLYKVSAPYKQECEVAIHWNDPDIGICWPDIGPPQLSDKDRAAPAFATHKPVFVHGER